VLSLIYVRSIALALVVGLFAWPASFRLWSMLVWCACASVFLLHLFLTLARLERIEESMLPRNFRWPRGEGGQ